MITIQIEKCNKFDLIFFPFFISNKFKSKLVYNSLQYFKTKNQMIKLEHKKIGKYIMFTNKKVAQLKRSSIFLGINTQNKEKVLVKVVSKKQYETNDVLKNSFNFELSSMNVLKSTNILKFIELIMTEKNYYLILEEPQGDSFKKILQKKGPLKEKQLRSYLRKIRPTFKTLHENNTIHGNINSKSVLIEHSQIKLGYPSYIKTIEILKSNASNQQQFLMEQNFQKKMDYSYLPPELLASGMISMRHDIWSFGVVVYQALFGSLPWNITACSTPLEMAWLMMNEKINFSNEIKISKQMKHFLVGCLQTDPFKRLNWEQVIDHAVFTKNIETEQQKNTDQEGGSHEIPQGHHWSYIQKIVKTNFTITQ